MPSGVTKVDPTPEAKASGEGTSEQATLKGAQYHVWR